MAETPNNNWPEMFEAQAGNETQFNEFQAILDGVLRKGVKDELDTPPGSPAEGDTYLIIATATGDWVGQEDNLATYVNGAWKFTPAQEGWRLWIDTLDLVKVYNGASWIIFSTGGGGSGSGSSGPIPDIILEDQKSSTTSGQTLTGGVWNSRNLTTEVRDLNNDCILSDPDFELTEGIYRIRVECPGYYINRHKVKIINDPSGSPSDILFGSSEYSSVSGSGVQTTTFLDGVITVSGTSAQRTFRVEHYAETSSGADAGGVQTGDGSVERYLRVYLWKETNTLNIVPDIILQDQKATTTDGQGLAAGVFTRKDLNTEVRDVNNNCTLAANQFTLDEGTYRIVVESPAVFVNRNKVKLVVDPAGANTDLLFGTSRYSPQDGDMAGVVSVIDDEIIVVGTAAQRTFEIWHYAQFANGSNGGGVATGDGSIEKYTTVKLWKVS